MTPLARLYAHRKLNDHDRYLAEAVPLMHKQLLLQGKSDNAVIDVLFELFYRLHFKRLAMLDMVQEELEAMDAADQAAMFDSSLMLCVGELRNLMAAVIDVLEGEAE